MSDEDWATAKEIVVRWGNLEKFFGELEEVGAQAKQVEQYAVDQVFNKSGFDYWLCVLQPLADAMGTCDGVFTDLRTTFDDRWEELLTALSVAAEEFEAADGGTVHAFLKPYLDLLGEK